MCCLVLSNTQALHFVHYLWQSSDIVEGNKIHLRDNIKLMLFSTKCVFVLIIVVVCGRTGAWKRRRINLESHLAS